MTHRTTCDFLLGQQGAPVKRVTDIANLGSVQISPVNWFAERVLHLLASIRTCNSSAELRRPNSGVPETNNALSALRCPSVFLPFLAPDDKFLTLLAREARPRMQSLNNLLNHVAFQESEPFVAAEVGVGETVLVQT